MLDVTVAASLPELDPGLERRVEALWRDEQAQRGASLFNGTLLSVVSHTSERIEAGITEYRRFVAQRRDPALFAELKARPLAVSGLTRCRDGIIFGRRSKTSTQDAGRWELVPSGGVDGRAVQPGGSVSLTRQLMEELREEVGCSSAAVTFAEPFLLVEDTETGVVDIGIDLVLDLDADSVLGAHRGATDEYNLLRIVPVSELAQFVAQAEPPVVEVSLALLEARGWLARGAMGSTGGSL
jgi:hypothetical protein